MDGLGRTIFGQGALTKFLATISEKIFIVSVMKVDNDNIL